MTVSFRQRVSAVIAFLIVLAFFIEFTLTTPATSNWSLHYPISGLYAHITPVRVVEWPSGKTIWALYTPGGPHYTVTVQSDQHSLPITKVNILLNVTIGFEPGHQTWVLDFPQVNNTHPLNPGRSASQNITFIGLVSTGDDVTLVGCLSDGTTFNFQAKIDWQDE